MKERIICLLSQIFGKEPVEEMILHLQFYVDGFENFLIKPQTWNLAWIIYALACFDEENDSASNVLDKVHPVLLADLVTQISIRLSDVIPFENPDLLFLEQVEISKSFVKFTYQNGPSYLYGKRIEGQKSKVISGADFIRIFLLTI